MNRVKITTKILLFLTCMAFCVVSVYLSGCSNNSTSSPYQTDQQWLQSVVNSGYPSGQSDEDNLMGNERYDFNDSVAVSDNNGGPMDPIDSLLRWGRIVENVQVNLNGAFSGDTLYSVAVTRVITGHYRIIGYKNGLPDSVNKPYSETLNRNIIFKRVDRKADPRFNWRVYQISLLSGTTTTPQNGNTNTQISNIQILINGNPAYNWSGDFTQTMFTTYKFGGNGIPHANTGDQVTINVTVNSNELNNYVAWHWARNTFGFHRIPFTFVSAVPGGNGYYVTFTKTFNIYSGHRLGVFNGYISANTHESLWDDNLNLFSSTEVGIPYRIQ